MSPEEKEAAQQAWEKNLPVVLRLFCLQEGIPRPFGRKEGSVYECPCGIFRWDVNAGRETET